MSSEVYNWDRKFRIRILTLCFQKNWFSRFGAHIIKPEYFESKEEQTLCKFILSFYDKYKRSPYPDEVLAEFNDCSDLLDTLVCDVLELVTSDNNNELVYAEDKALEFAQQQAMKLAILASVDDITTGHTDKPVERMKEAMRVGLDLEDLGIDLYDDKSKWMYPSIADDEQDIIATGLYHVDVGLKGGLPRKWYGLLVGPPHGGKTTHLINIGCGAASLVSKANVLHITLEMDAKSIAERYADRIMMRNGEHATYTADAFDNSYNLKMRGKIRIKHFARELSLTGLEAYIDTLEYINFIPDVLIVDYCDLMEINHNREYRFELDRLSRGLRAIGDEKNMAVWSASQATRSSASKELLSLGDLAESFGKAAIPDVILGIGLSPEEKSAGVSRLHCLKTRVNHTAADWLVRCKFDSNANSIETTEYVKMKDWLDDRAEKSSHRLKIAEK